MHCNLAKMPRPNVRLPKGTLTNSRAYAVFADFALNLSQEAFGCGECYDFPSLRKSATTGNPEIHVVAAGLGKSMQVETSGLMTN